MIAWENWKKAADLPARLKAEIEQFVLSATLFTDKRAKVTDWRGPKAAADAERLAFERDAEAAPPFVAATDASTTTAAETISVTIISGHMETNGSSSTMRIHNVFMELSPRGCLE